MMNQGQERTETTPSDWRRAMTDLTGRTAIVTGGARGQGEAEVRLMIECGARVMICDVLAEAGEALAEELGESACFHALDVTDADGWEEVVAKARDWTGRLDILVNNAGIINRSLIVTTTPEAWRRVIEVNLTGAFLGLRATAPLIAAGGGGSIVNIASHAAFTGHSDPAYSASKWGLRGLTKTAAMEFAAKGVRVNTVCPGHIVTSLNRDGIHHGPMIALTPLGRSGEVGEVAQLVLYLASDASRFVTGEEFTLDGGFIAGAAYRRVAVETGAL